MPTIPSIRTSIENQSVLIRDPHAKNGQFLRDARGRLRSYSGGFTVVYPYTSNGEKWAFRCWHAELGNVRKDLMPYPKLYSVQNYLIFVILFTLMKELLLMEKSIQQRVCAG